VIFSRVAHDFFAVYTALSLGREVLRRKHNIFSDAKVTTDAPLCERLKHKQISALSGKNA
jgi:hypothetical protein